MVSKRMLSNTTKFFSRMTHFIQLANLLLLYNSRIQRMLGVITLDDNDIVTNTRMHMDREEEEEALQRLLATETS